MTVRALHSNVPRGSLQVKAGEVCFHRRLKEEWLVEFLCRVMRVTSRGFRAWWVRPMSQRQRGDMVILAHIREQHRLSLQSYGRPRMTEELQ